MQRYTEVTVELAFDSTDFDVDATATFSVAPETLSDYTGDAFTRETSATTTIKIKAGE